MPGFVQKRADVPQSPLSTRRVSYKGAMSGEHAGKTFYITALGCRTNQYEAAAISSQLQGLGYVPVQGHEHADLCIVNTCAVTANAEASSRRAIRALAKQHPNARVVVTGCLAVKNPEALRKIDGVSEVFPEQKREQLVEWLFPGQPVPPFAISQFSGHTRAFVKIQDGCDHFCSYCTVPLLRGRSRSRSLPEIIEEVQRLVCSGHKEIVCTGIDIGAYAWKGTSLADLVRAIDTIPGVCRLRLSSINPDEVDEALTEAILRGRSTCPSMHLVLQSGSDALLSSMRRRYTSGLFLEKALRMVQARPDFSFSTDVIVGYPGETEEDVEATICVLSQIPCVKTHIFPFSARPKTAATYLPQKVPQSVIKDRKARVAASAEGVAASLKQRYIGQTIEILTENTVLDQASGRGTMMYGMTANAIPVFVPSEGLFPNMLCTVQLVGRLGDGLEGKKVAQC